MAQFAVLEKLQQEVNITLAYNAYFDVSSDLLDELQERLPRVTLISLVSPTAPRPLPTLCEKLRHRLSTFKKRLTSKTKMDPRPKDDVFLMVDSPLRPKSPFLIEQLNTLLNSQKFDVVQVEFFEHLDLVSLVPAHIPTIFIHHEVRFKRLQMEAGHSSTPHSFKSYVIQITQDIELNYLRKYHRIIVFNEADKTWLSTLGNRISVIPFPLPEIAFKTIPVFNGKINKLIFVGGEFHAPNKQGILWFISHCFDSFWQQFQIPLYIIGNWLPSTIEQYQRSGQVTFTGIVPELDPWYEGSVLVCPILSGSGIRVKVLTAAAAGVPVISSAIGAEGSMLIPGRDFLLAEDTSDYISAFSQLQADPNETLQMVRKAQQKIKCHFFSEKAVVERLQMLNYLAAQEQKCH